MSSFYCEECDRLRNRKWHGAYEYDKNPGHILICEECFNKVGCGHEWDTWLWEFKPDTQGDGRDCSYYACRDCGATRYPEDMPKQTNGGF
jgi:hypothetical protein